ncbi:MAG TPA: hypothetical protein VIL18_01390 [Longimicrobiales bacterium]
MRLHPLWPAPILAAAVLACSAEPDDNAARERTSGSDSAAASGAADNAAAAHDTAAAPSGGAERPATFPFPLPYVVDAECEYCWNPVVVCAPVQVRAEVRPDADVVFTLEPGDSVSMVTGRWYVEVPDVVVFNDTLRVPDLRNTYGFGFPPEMDSVVFLPGDTAYVFTYGSEGGMGDWWYRGELLQTDNVWLSPPNIPWAADGDRPVATSLGTRVAQWWMKIRTADGREGWIPDDTMTVRYANHYDPEIRPCPAGRSAGAEPAADLPPR